MKLTVKQILENTSDDELFCLFGEFLKRIVEKTESTGVFSVDEGKPVFLDKDVHKVIVEMKK